MFQNIRESPLKLPLYLSREVRDIIPKLMNRNPKLRLGVGKQGVEEIKNHPWFKSIDWGVAVSRKLPVPKLETQPITVNDKEGREILNKEEDDKYYIEGWDFQKD